jgi:hypothetical protein
MADEELRAELERLRAENEQLKNKGVRGLSLKVSEKGGLSLYGVGRFPVTQTTKSSGGRSSVWPERSKSSSKRTRACSRPRSSGGASPVLSWWSLRHVFCGELEDAAYPFRATIVSPFDFVRMSTSVMTNLWPTVIWLPTYFSATSGLT